MKSDIYPVNIILIFHYTHTHTHRQRRDKKRRRGKKSFYTLTKKMMPVRRFHYTGDAEEKSHSDPYREAAEGLWRMEKLSEGEKNMKELELEAERDNRREKRMKGEEFRAGNF